MTNLILKLCKTNLHKITGLPRFLQHLWQLFFQYIQRDKKLRLSGSLLVSITIHALALTCYFMLTAIEDRMEPQIREIQFIDMTEAPKPVPQPKPEPRRTAPPKLAAISAPSVKSEESVSPAKVSLPTKTGNDKKLLDRRRRQAPIRMTRESVMNLNQSSNVLKISPAMGLKRDQRVARPAAIELNRDKKLVSLDKSTQNGALSVDHRPEPALDLNRKTLSTAGEEGAIKIAKPHPKTATQVREIVAKRTQTLITGPLADRSILTRIMPAFPEWAKRQGIGASITLRFTVMESGKVKENVIVEHTSGSRQWDRQVIDVLKQWVFEALPNSGIRRDQTGSITFQFVI